jgi:pyruvate/2-oxoglutarate dehydrogenase complex dihydrolipoamide acyltransferase (E2) component
VTVGETIIAFCGSGGGSVANPTRTARQRSVTVEASPAQRRVLVALCRPLRAGRYVAPASNRQIADELVLAIDTVKGTHARLFELFEVDELPQNQKRSALAPPARTSAPTSTPATKRMARTRRRPPRPRSTAG